MAGTVNPQLPLPTPSAPDAHSILRTFTQWANSLVNALFTYGQRINICLPKDGTEAMTGALTLPADPTSALQAATKQYVDAAVSGVPSAFTTGDVKVTLKTVADTGWVMFDDGTIGDASSGGTTRANADTSALFTLLWNNTTNANCAVSGGRGASAAADFAAHKAIAVPKVLGRALAATGTGSGLTARALAATVGAETHLLTSAEIPAPTPATSVLSTVASGASVGQIQACAG